MSKLKSGRRRIASKGGRQVTLQKSQGTLHPRVQKVGPEHFGIVCVDCAKGRSKWLLGDFYHRLLVEPTFVDHQRGQLAAMILRIGELAREHQLQDLVVSIERTGDYHLPVKRAFDAAEFDGRKFDTRIVHPFATKQHRQAVDPGDKTDDNDLAAMFRATVAGFGLQEPPWDDVHRQLHLWARHRRDLVEKRSAVCCQLREHLEAVLPGYAALFDDLWKTPLALRVARDVTGPSQCSAPGTLAAQLRAAGLRFQNRTLEKIVAWAANAPAPDAQAATHHRIGLALDDDRQQKTGQIQALEQELAHLLVQTPYVLLLSCPGINVVSAAELAGEMGPISNYAQANRISGRAGLYRSRYQSDEVDRQHGPLVRMCNRRLRAVLMMIADNLATCNPHYRGWAELGKARGQDPRYVRVKIATRFTRVIFQLVAGRQVLRHPSMRGRDYILDKLMRFHQEHKTPLLALLADLQQAVGQLPRDAHAEEAVPLAAELERTRAARRGVKPIADILPLVLARLGAGNLQSTGETREPR
jgi:transposase